MLRRISTIITCLPLPFISYTLDEIFVEIADIQVPDLRESKLKSELSILWTQLQAFVIFMGPSPSQGIGETRRKNGTRHNLQKFATELQNKKPTKRTLTSYWTQAPTGDNSLDSARRDPCRGARGRSRTRREDLQVDRKHCRWKEEPWLPEFRVKLTKGVSEEAQGGQYW